MAFCAPRNLRWVIKWKKVNNMMPATLEFSRCIWNTELHDLTYGQLHDVHLKSSCNSNSEKRAFEHICYFAPSFSGASIILLLMQKKVGIFSLFFSCKRAVLLKFMDRGWKWLCNFVWFTWLMLHSAAWTATKGHLFGMQVAASGNDAHLNARASCSLIVSIMNCICSAVVKCWTQFINIM